MNTLAQQIAETPTPETDAAIKTVDVAFVGYDGLSSSPEEYVEPDFARKLERQRDEARRDADLMRPFDETQVDKIIAERDALAARSKPLEDALRDIDEFIRACGHGTSGQWDNADRKELLAAIHGSLVEWPLKYEALNKRLHKALKTIDELNEAAIDDLT